MPASNDNSVTGMMLTYAAVTAALGAAQALLHFECWLALVLAAASALVFAFKLVTEPRPLA